MLSARILTQALRASSRNILRTNLTRSSVAVPRVVRTFSTTLMRASAPALNAVVSSELEFEKTDAFSLDETFVNYLKEAQFEIVETGDSVLAELTKTVGASTVHVYFDVQRITQTAFELRQLEDEINNNEEYNDEFVANQELGESAFSEVNVVVEKYGKAVGFDMLLSISENQFSINGVTNFENAKDALSDAADAVAKRDLLYSGPAVTSLAEELQEAMNDYLVSLGVNQELAQFILAYSTFKENNMYISWLSKLKNFTA